MGHQAVIWYNDDPDLWEPHWVKGEAGVGGAVRFLVVGTIGQEERPPRGQLWMEECLTSLKYWPI